MAVKTTKRCLMILGAALVFFTGTGHAAGGNVVTVASIDFRGLRCLGKYELLSGAGVKRSDRGLVVDIDALVDCLKKEPLVEKYDIRHDNSALTVTVAEKKPVYIIAAVKGESTTLFEVDGGLNVLSVHRVHAIDQPVIIIDRADTAGGALSSRLKKLLASLSVIREDNQRLGREISTLDLRGYPSAVMTLRGRGTRYFIDVKDLAAGSLDALVGYVDRFGGRPEWVEYHGDFAVMK